MRDDVTRLHSQHSMRDPLFAPTEDLDREPHRFPHWGIAIVVLAAWVLAAALLARRALADTLVMLVPLLVYVLVPVTAEKRDDAHPFR